MIPVKLILQGLYSYREKQEIDFTRLTQAGLFGIFGSVGSGKSSILEAISFALYGESERLNTRDNRNYNMMNLKSNELLIDFEFKTHDNTSYRFVVKGKRNSKQFDDVKAFAFSAYRFDQDEWVPIDPKSIEQITGLNYKNFRRTIIIPQGKFQEFLQLNPTDRTTMLKELFNLDKYELSDKVIRLESANTRLKENIDGQLKGIGEIDPSHLEHLKNEILRLNEAITTQKQELEIHRKQEQALSALKTLVDKYNMQRAEQEKLLANNEYFAKLEHEIKQYEMLSLLFHSDLAQLKMVDKNLHLNKLELDQNIVSQADLKQHIDEWQTRINHLKPQYETREQLLQRNEELNKIITIHQNEAEITILETRLQKGRQTLLNNDNEIEAKQTKLKELEDLLVELKNNIPDLRELAATKQFHLEEGLLILQRVEIGNKLEAIMTALVDQLAKAEKILSESPDLSQILIEVPEIQDSDTSGRLISKAHEEQYRRIIDHYEILVLFCKEKTQEKMEIDIQLKLEQYASQLHDGKPCPLCGALSHPFIFYHEDLALKSAALAAELEEVEGHKTELMETIKILEKFYYQIYSDATQNETGFEKIKEIDKQLLKLYDSYKGRDMRRDELAEEYNRYDKQSLQIKQIEKEIKILNDVLRTANQNKDRFTKAIHDLEKDFIGKQSSIELLTQQINLLDISDYKAFEDLDLRQLILQHQTTYQTITAQYLQAEKELTTLTSTLNTLIGKLEVGRQNNSAFTEQLAVIHDRISKKLTEVGNLELATVETILQKQLDCESAKQRIGEYKQQLETARKTIELLEIEINQQVYNEEEHQQLLLLIVTLDGILAEMNRSQGENEKELKQLNENAERYNLLKKEYDRLVLRGQDIGELKALFRSSGFVNYVSTVYLQNLCAAANDRFYQMTRQKLGLELADDNSFHVRDYMNEGKLRSVKTLSGGQTFQASLSLALSLADSIHKIAGSSENFFFLDEGFGTLDKESLEVVFESLKALRRENRIVGVISHVEDMQQEIETFLKVVNHDEQGSIVRSSWELL